MVITMEKARKPVFLSRRVLHLPVESIHPNPNQPRRYFEEAALEELSESIRQYGILQPLTVRRSAGSYELIAGERRSLRDCARCRACLRRQRRKAPPFWR